MLDYWTDLKYDQNCRLSAGSFASLIEKKSSTFQIYGGKNSLLTAAEAIERLKRSFVTFLGDEAYLETLQPQ